MTDGDLVRLVVAGHSATYGVLARRWYYRILAFCQARVSRGRLHDAEDLTQEVFIRGYKKLGSLAEPDCFGTWIRSIASHACADWGRDQQQFRRHLQAIGQTTDLLSMTSVNSLGSNEDRDQIMQQVATLPDDLREVILLHYYENLTYDDMARWLEVSRATVNERLSKARGLLRIRLAALRSNV